MKVVKVRGIRKARDLYRSLPQQPSYCQDYWFLARYESHRVFGFIRRVARKILGRPDVARLMKGEISHLRNLSSYAVYGDDGNLLLVAPLYSCNKNDRIVAGSVSWVNSADFVYADASDMKLREAFYILLEFLNQEGCSKLYWQFLHESSKSAVYIRDFHPKIYATSKNTRISLDFVDYESYIKTLKKSAAQNRRTAYNRLSRENHTLSFSYSYEPNDIQNELESLYKVRQNQKYGYKNRFRWFMWKYLGGGAWAISQESRIRSQINYRRSNSIIYGWLCTSWSKRGQRADFGYR